MEFQAVNNFPAKGLEIMNWMDRREFMKTASTTAGSGFRTTAAGG
jgi:hypothetical protein